MEIYSSDSKKDEIIKKTWNYLLQTGIANASIGALCKEEHISQSSLYYWFKNKDDIWISAGKYGLSKVVEYIFAYTLINAQDIRKYFDTLLDEVEKYKFDLRLALQITTNPVFGERMRDKSKEFNLVYDQFGGKLIELFGCSVHDAKVFIYTVVTVVQDYAIWNDREPTQMLLENLYDRVVKKFKIFSNE